MIKSFFVNLVSNIIKTKSVENNVELSVEMIDTSNSDINHINSDEKNNSVKIGNDKIGSDNISEHNINDDSKHDCDHGWVSYDRHTLEKIITENQRKAQSQLEPLLVKLNSSNNNNNDSNNDSNLINKMIDLIITYRKQYRAKGTCMVCNEEIEVIYLHGKNYAILHH